MPVCHYWLLLLGGKRADFPSARTKIPLLRKKILQKKLIRKNAAKKVVENYRQASGGGHLQPIRA